jgi:hypothetical protein
VNPTDYSFEIKSYIERKLKHVFTQMMRGFSMGLKEAYLHDHLAVSLIGFLFGSLASAGAEGARGSWPSFVAIFVVAGIFLIVPGGFVAAYLRFRLHRIGENLEMQGLSAGFFTGFVYTVITFFLSLAHIIADSKIAVDIMVGWIIGVIFAFLFYSLGGYLAGVLERRPFAMPGVFNLSRISRAPPPPPTAAAQTCPTCGQPLTFVQQYNRWYCQNEKKYV